MILFWLEENFTNFKFVYVYFCGSNSFIVYSWSCWSRWRRWFVGFVGCRPFKFNIKLQIILNLNFSHFCCDWRWFRHINVVMTLLTGWNTLQFLVASPISDAISRVPFLCGCNEVNSNRVCMSWHGNSLFTVSSRGVPKLAQKWSK